MPTKRMRLVRRRAVAELAPACWRYLCDLQKPGDAGSDEMIGFEYFDDPMSIETAWQRHGGAAIDAHQAVHGPNSVPASWFRYGLPGSDGGDGSEVA
jgi:hypothetical protein